MVIVVVTEEEIEWPGDTEREDLEFGENVYSFEIPVKLLEKCIEMCEVI